MKFIIETGHPDANGDVVDLQGLVVKASVPLTLGFDRRSIVGLCNVTQEDGVLKAECDMPHLPDGYPAIGFTVQKAVENEHGGRTFLKTDLKEVSICTTPNKDPNIKRLSEQSTDA